MSTIVNLISRILLPRRTVSLNIVGVIRINAKPLNFDGLAKSRHTRESGYPAFV
jgi:hypothetical protein